MNKEQVTAALEWAKGNPDRTAKIEQHGDMTSFFVSEFSGLNHKFSMVKEEDGTDFDALLERKFQQEKRAEYERLKAEFEDESAIGGEK